MVEVKDLREPHGKFIAADNLPPGKMKCAEPLKLDCAQYALRKIIHERRIAELVIHNFDGKVLFEVLDQPQSKIGLHADSCSIEDHCACDEVFHARDVQSILTCELCFAVVTQRLRSGLLIVWSGLAVKHIVGRHVIDRCSRSA